MREKLYSTNEAAQLLDVSPGRIRQMIADGAIEFERIGRDNFVTEKGLEMAKSRHTKPGPKPKTEAKPKKASKI